MAFIPIFNARPGQVPMEDWLNWSVQPTVIDSFNSTMSPIIDSGRFQRVIREGRFATAVTASGSTVLFNTTVPELEAWDVNWINVVFTDPGGAKDWSIFVTRAAGEIYCLARKPVGSSAENMLYPGRVLLPGSASSSQFDYAGPLELWEGDTLSIRMESAATGVGTANCTLRYEEIPHRRRHRQNLANAETVVVP